MSIWSWIISLFMIVVFEPLPFTMWISCCLYIYICCFITNFSIFQSTFSGNLKKVNDDFYFQNDGLLTSWILKFFSGPYGSEGQNASAVRISSKSVKRFFRYRVFSIFKMSAVCNLGFLKSQNFICWWVHHAKFRQKWSVLCGYIAHLRFFKMTIVCHLAFLNFKCFAL